MRLFELQNSFITFLRGEFEDDSTQLRAEIVDGGRISREQRLHIYHHAYRARLVEVMQDVFERTWAYLGDDGFESAARNFIEVMPSAEHTLNRYGEQFPAWLTEHFPDDIDISEVARIDWMMRCAFDGVDAAPLTTSALALLSADDWATVGFTFHPSVAVAPIVNNAASIWESLEQGLTPPVARKLETASFLLVWRKDLRPHFVTIGQAESEAIALLRSGESFAATCGMLETRYPDEDAVQTMGASLRRWLDEGMLTATCVGPVTPH